MFIAVIEGIKYINDIPEELTEKAIEAGEIKKGSTVGVLIHPIDDPQNRVLIELRITRKGQEKMVIKGCAMPLEYVGGRYCITDDAIDYIISQRVNAKKEDEKTIRPFPRAI